MNTELGIFLLIVLITLLATNDERRARVMFRNADLLERKLNLLLQRIGIDSEGPSSLSDAVKELARDPNRKIEAIKLYREETGTGLAEAKEAIEAFIRSQ